MWFFYFHCCHAYPNDKLLQRDDELDKVVLEVVMPIQTISFYNLFVRLVCMVVSKLSCLSKR